MSRRGSKLLRRLSSFGQKTPSESIKIKDVNSIVDNVRAAFIERAEKSPDDYDYCDIQKVKENDFTVRRFVIYQNMDHDAALQQLDDAMKWRKSFGINRLDYKSCSIETFKCGGIFHYNEDKDGRPVLYFRVKTHIKVPKLEKYFQNIVALLIEKVDNIANERGVVVVMDFTGAGIRHVDMGMAKFMITIMRKYYPEILSYVILYNFPWILRGLLPVVNMLMGDKYSNKLRALNGEEMFEYIDRKNVPKYLGGDCTIDFTIPPQECTKYAEDICDDYNLTKDEIRKCIKVFEPIINEAQKLVSL